MAPEDGEYRIREPLRNELSVIGRKTNSTPDRSFCEFLQRKRQLYSVLLVHLVLAPSDNNKTELPAETYGLAKDTVCSKMTKLLICVCVCFLLSCRAGEGSARLGKMKELLGPAHGSPEQYTSHLSKEEVMLKSDVEVKMLIFMWKSVCIVSTWV